ncbi:type VI lipase adapter Tla3 domain-containing protein [Pseudomonas weihenstephanensis]|uniref:type VI lipase adapter Tla3 domain-containing protein n=1 Tax=Pseudomonas weihenstephanensis TaxID=1608994 RepID=UPI003B848112
MRLLTTSLIIYFILWAVHSTQAVASDSVKTTKCFLSPETSVKPYISAKKIPIMPTDTRYRAPLRSQKLDTLDVLSLGLSVDVFRQGKTWEELEAQSKNQHESLHTGSILPMDPMQYPTTADDKDMASAKREADALELGLRNFLEKWPIPTITIVRGWNPTTPNLRFTPGETQESLNVMVNDMRIPAGLHWHRIRNMQNGIICNDTPEGAVEYVFQLFEQHPDLPALLIYVNEGISMAGALSTKDISLRSLGATSGPRQTDKLTDAMVALVVGRPERVEWLRYYAQYAKVNDNKIDPEFRGWGWRKPPVEFQPSEFIPQPWTQRAFEQWDAMQVLAKIHRPVTVSLKRPDNGERLKREALSAQLAAGWNKATDALVPKPARLFYDGGLNSRPIAELSPALHAAHSSLDLLDSRESYDLTQRLGDTGSASPFVGIALATMASYLNADTSVVMPMRRQDQATIIPITSATPGKKPVGNPFGINLMPQTASSDETTEIKPEPVRQVPAIRPLADEDYTLEEFLAEQNKNRNWMDEL